MVSRGTMSGLENLMDNFSLSNSTSMKGKSMNAMKGGATTSTPMSTAKSSKAEADPVSYTHLTLPTILRV